MTHSLHIEALTFTYRQWRPPTCAIDDWTITSGVHVLVGANGSGKSTLLKLLAGLLTPRAGRLEFDGHDLAVDHRRRQAFAPTGYLAQDYSVRGRTSVRAFAEYGAWMHGVNSADLRSRATAALREVGLDEPEKAVGKLSGGMQRRLGLAIEVAHDPLLVLLDEPTSGLDSDARVEMQRIVSRRVEAGAIVLLASHEESEIARTDCNIHLMHEGRIARSLPHRAGDLVRISELLHGDAG